MLGVYLPVIQLHLDQFLASRRLENIIEKPQQHFFGTEYAFEQVVVGPVDPYLCQCPTLFLLLLIA